jgi:hypothetical protein
VDAAALWVALSIDPVTVAANLPVPAEPVAPDVGEPPPPEIVAPTPPTEAPPARETSTVPPTRGPTPRAATTTPRATRRPDEVLLSASGGPEIGALPGLAGAASVSIGLGWPRLRLELGATWIGVRTESTDVASVRVQIAAATMRACGRLGRGRVEVPLCGGTELGAVRGAGRDGVGVRTAIGPWIAPLADAGVVGWVRPRLALTARAQVAVPVVSMAFVARDPGPAVELYRTGPVSARLWLGLETKFSIGRDGSG